MQPQLSITNMVERLVPIWQGVLQRPSVSIDDDFFDLGGTRALAEQLLAQIKELAGQEFPAVSIYHMNSPGTMASALLQTREQRRFSPPVLMKAGRKGPPVFFSHGIASDLLECRELVQDIQTERPIYGIQSRGIYGIEEPFRRVEDMAGYHLQAIRRTQSQGPYSLIGYSLGGLVMFEVARMLLTEDERIDLLVLIDSYPYRTHLKPLQQAALYFQRVIHRISKLWEFKTQRSVAGIVAPTLLSELKNSTTTNNRVMLAGLKGNLRLWFEREREDAYTALMSYKPRFYNGAIKFIRAGIPTQFPLNANAVWGCLAKQVEVETLPGDHVRLLTTHFKSVAGTLSGCLAENTVRRS